MLFLEERLRMGTLDLVLEEAGYHREPGEVSRWVYREPMQVNRLEATFA
jgi:hypothetical protein